MSLTGARVVIGFDLGSTASKIVFRNHALPEASWTAEFPSDFALADRRLLRTAMVETRSGFALPSSPNLTAAMPVKEILLPGGGAEDETAAGEARAAAFAGFALALALRSGADWMTRQGGVARWHLVIGVPVGSVDDRAVVDRARRIAAAGWILAARTLAGGALDGELRREDVRSALAEAGTPLRPAITSWPRGFGPTASRPTPKVWPRCSGTPTRPICRKGSRWCSMSVGGRRISPR